MPNNWISRPRPASAESYGVLSMSGSPEGGSRSSAAVRSVAYISTMKTVVSFTAYRTL
jgi:hypothetical protein